MVSNYLLLISVAVIAPFSRYQQWNVEIRLFCVTPLAFKVPTGGQWRRSQVKSGGHILRRVKGWGLGRGCALPVGVWGLAPRKKCQFCAKNYAILSKFWYFFPILQYKNFQRIRESGGLSPSPRSGGPIPLSPLLRRLCRGFPWDLREILQGVRCQMPNVQHRAKYCRSLTVWVGRTNVTDDRQTTYRHLL